METDGPSAGTQDEFKETILPSIKPLFAVKDPPQTMLSLLDSLKMLHDKCNAVTFREGMPDLSAFDSIGAVLIMRTLCMQRSCLWYTTRWTAKSSSA